MRTACMPLPFTGRSTLKTLCPEDKHKVRQLIEDLAKTGAEKDAIEQLLCKERHQFDQKLSQLQLEQQDLIEERTSILLTIQRYSRLSTCAQYYLNSLFHMTGEEFT